MRIAVTDVFFKPLAEICDVFRKKTGLIPEIIQTAGQYLFAEIIDGASFDLFFSSGPTLPERLHRLGLAAKPFAYAVGHATLWSHRAELTELPDWTTVLTASEVRKVAVPPNDSDAYARAAAKALDDDRLQAVLRGKLVKAASPLHAYALAAEGQVDAAFTACSIALSGAGGRGKFWPVPKAPEIVQKGCVLRRSSSREAAVYLQNLATSGDVAPILHRYGLVTPA